MEIILDRFEGEFAVVELPDKKTINVPKILLAGAKQGDVVDITIRKSLTEKRKSDIQNIFDSLKN